MRNLINRYFKRFLINPRVCMTPCKLRIFVSSVISLHVLLKNHWQKDNGIKKQSVLIKRYSINIHITVVRGYARYIIRIHIYSLIRIIPVKKYLRHAYV